MKKIFVLSALSLITLSMYAMEREEYVCISMYAMEREETEQIKAARQRRDEIEQFLFSQMSSEERQAHETDLQEKLQKIRSATTPEQKAEVERMIEEAHKQRAEIEKEYGMPSAEKPS